MGDLYEVTSPVLGVARFTSWEADVTFGGNVYSAGVVVPMRERVRSRLGLETDALEMEIGFGPASVYGATSVAWPAAALGGALDGASVKLYRAFFTTAGALVDAVLLFGGYVGEIQARSTSIGLTIESLLAKLQAPWPRNVAAVTCGWDLYSSGCGLTRPTTWDAKTTLASSAANVVKVGTLTDQGFAFGYVAITAPSSSSLVGLSRTIVSVAASGADLLLTVAPALPSIPGAGLTVKVVKGCAKSAAVCDTSFANLARFSGLPLLPPESAVGG
jgi:hypothetical protein